MDNLWQCRLCSSQNKEWQKQCTFCAASKPCSWTCDYCTMVNDRSDRCTTCNNSRAIVISEEEIFQCPYCNNILSSLLMLTEHVQLHLQPPTSPQHQAPRRESLASKAIYACHMCGATFDLETRLVEHVASHESPTSSQPTSNEPDTGTMTEGLADLITQQRGWSRFVICPYAVHFGPATMDMGWGCGYRNLQMLLRYLSKTLSFLPQSMTNYPGIPHLQKCIEHAWSIGFDPVCRSQQGGSVYKTKKLIGTSEVASVLLSHGVRAQIFEFKANRHRLFEWVKDYFTKYTNDSWRPPLYLQYKGHSLSIMGIALNSNNEVHLVIFDPGMGGLKFKGFLKIGKTQKIIRNVNQFDRPDYQLIMIKDNRQIPEWELERYKQLQVTQRY